MDFSDFESTDFLKIAFDGVMLLVIFSPLVWLVYTIFRLLAKLNEKAGGQLFLFLLSLVVPIAIGYLSPFAFFYIKKIYPIDNVKQSQYILGIIFLITIIWCRVAHYKSPPENNNT